MHTVQKDTTFTKIFVGGLPYHTTDSSLRKYFEVFGDIDEAVVITDRQTSKSRGYGFVSIRSPHRRPGHAFTFFIFFDVSLLSSNLCKDVAASAEAERRVQVQQVVRRQHQTLPLWQSACFFFDLLLYWIFCYNAPCVWRVTLSVHRAVARPLSALVSSRGPPLWISFSPRSAAPPFPLSVPAALASYFRPCGNNTGFVAGRHNR